MNKEFEVHQLTSTGITKAHDIAYLFNDLLNALNAHYCPNNREFSIVKTKLEEACFFARKSMALSEMAATPEDGTPE